MSLAKLSDFLNGVPQNLSHSIQKQKTGVDQNADFICRSNYGEADTCDASNLIMLLIL